MSKGNRLLPHASSWTARTLDLSSYAGQSIKVRFHFDTFDSAVNGYLGWQVDDIQLSGYDEDAYSFTANAGDVLSITTATPGDGSGEPVNGLDPALLLYAPGGSLVAQDLNGAADGRNAVLNYTVPAGQSGVYCVLVRATAGPGDYTVNVAGATGAPAAFPSVTSTSIANGALIAAYPNTYRVTFSRPVLLSSVDASDLTVNGTAATRLHGHRRADAGNSPSPPPTPATACTRSPSPMVPSRRWTGRRCRRSAPRSIPTSRPPPRHRIEPDPRCRHRSRQFHLYGPVQRRHGGRYPGARGRHAGQ